MDKQYNSVIICIFVVALLITTTTTTAAGLLTAVALLLTAATTILSIAYDSGRIRRQPRYAHGLPESYPHVQAGR